MAQPPNLSGDAKGFNSKMFKSQRGVRRALKALGYGVNHCLRTIPTSTIRQFQTDYNKCAEKFGRWGKVDRTGKIDRQTLNALEHAIRWCKKRENRDGIPSARAWQSLCAHRRKVCRDTECEDGRSFSATPEKVEERETNFVEVMPDGTGKLRNIHTDDALRCSIIAFERYGEVVFAVVDVPSQGDLPNGRSEPISCPCVLGR